MLVEIGPFQTKKFLRINQDILIGENHLNLVGILTGDDDFNSSNRLRIQMLRKKWQELVETKYRDDEIDMGLLYRYRNHVDISKNSESLDYPPIFDIEVRKRTLENLRKAHPDEFFLMDNAGL